MTRHNDTERGSAMVLALGVLVVLAVLALVIVSMVTSEKKTESSEYANTRSFYSADAASEAGVHWLVMQDWPPALLDSLNNVQVSTGYTQLATDHMYRYDIQYVSKAFRPGWSVNYKDYQYQIVARGTSAGQSQAAVTLSASRLYREGY